MPLKPKQQECLEDFRSGKWDYFCHAGTAGSGKTFFDLALLHLMCSKTPGVRFAIGRKSEKNLKQTTIPSYNEMKRKTKSQNESYIVDFVAKYKNGSEIVFIWCDSSKDPELNNIRGLEVNGILFEEANQIDEAYFEVAKTRIGRWRKDLCPAFIIVNLNPSLGWVKDKFYDPWKEGTLPERYYFKEFDEEDAKDASGEEYVKRLGDLAPEEYKRFVKNNWNYSDIPNQLIRYEWYKQCIAVEPVEFHPVSRFIGATDPAWEGDDPTGYGMMINNHMGWWELFNKQDPDDSGDITFEKIKRFRVKQEDWIVDPVGIGSSTVLRLRKQHKYHPSMFYGGSPSTNMFGQLETFNKRSESLWLLGEAMRTEEITITHHPEFQRQCLAARYFIDEKKIRVLGKKEMKEELKVSPTYLDLAMMLIHKWKTENGTLAQELLQRQLVKPSGAVSTRAQRERTSLIKLARVRE